MTAFSHLITGTLHLQTIVKTNQLNLSQMYAISKESERSQMTCFPIFHDSILR